MGGHQVTHEFLYIPECPLPLLGRDLLSKLGALSTHERPSVRVGSTTYLLFLSATPQDEWRLPDLRARKPDRLNSQERELTQQFPEVWAEDNPPPRLSKHLYVASPHYCSVTLELTVHRNIFQCPFSPSVL